MSREELPHNPYNMGNGGVWREDGAVHKVLTPRGEGLRHWATSEDPGHWNSWRREAYIYETRLPAQLGLGAPELLEVRELEGGAVELVLEDVAGRHGGALTLADLAATARALGRAQGRARLPEAAWLSRGFLRTYATTRDVDYRVLGDDEAWRRPLIAEHFGAPLRRRLRELHARRDELLARAEAAPRTVAHLDVWPNNIILRDDGEPVLIDWQFTGDGALGEDVANLIPDAVIDLLFDHARIDELAEVTIDAYIDGLRDAGWTGRPDVVRAAIGACAVKYDWLMPHVLRDAARDPAEIRGYGAAELEDLDRFFAARAAALAWCAEVATGRPGGGP
jgi:hypothetical protein